MHQDGFNVECPPSLHKRLGIVSRGTRRIMSRWSQEPCPNTALTHQPRKCADGPLHQRRINASWHTENGNYVLTRHGWGGFGHHCTLYGHGILWLGRMIYNSGRGNRTPCGFGITQAASWHAAAGQVRLHVDEWIGSPGTGLGMVGSATAGARRAEARINLSGI